VPARQRSGFVNELIAPMSEVERLSLLRTVENLEELPLHEQDQAQAARREARRVLANVGEQEYPRNLDEAAYVRAALLVGGRAESYRCHHLQLGKSEPLFLAVGPPRVPVMCESCMASYLRSVRGTDEDRTCDLCGVIGDELTWSMPVRMAHIVLIAAYCESCLRRVQEWFDLVSEP